MLPSPPHLKLLTCHKWAGVCGKRKRFIFVTLNVRNYCWIYLWFSFTGAYPKSSLVSCYYCTKLGVFYRVDFRIRLRFRARPRFREGLSVRVVFRNNAGFRFQVSFRARVGTAMKQSNFWVFCCKRSPTVLYLCLTCSLSFTLISHPCLFSFGFSMSFGLLGLVSLLALAFCLSAFVFGLFLTLVI